MHAKQFHFLENICTNSFDSFEINIFLPCLRSARWYWICDVFELLFMQASLDVRIATFAPAIVWVCLVISKVVIF